MDELIDRVISISAVRANPLAGLLLIVIVLGTVTAVRAAHRTSQMRERVCLRYGIWRRIVHPHLIL